MKSFVKLTSAQKRLTVAVATRQTKSFDRLGSEMSLVEGAEAVGVLSFK